MENDDKQNDMYSNKQQPSFNCVTYFPQQVNAAVIYSL